MQLNHPKYHLGIFGVSGTGKSTYAQRFICNAPSSCVFIFDPEGEFALSLDLIPARTGAAIDAAVKSGWVCFDPTHLFPGDMEAALLFFVACVMGISDRLPGRKFVVIDELGTYITGNSIPRPFKHFVQTARRSGVDCVWMAQQPNELHNTVRNQLTEVVCHRLEDDCALEFPISRGFNPDELRNLPVRAETPNARHYWVARDQQRREARGN